MTSPKQVSFLDDRRNAQVFIGLVIFFVFFRVLTSGFVNIDDSIHTYRNPHLNPPTIKGIVELWAEPYRRLYVPLTYTAWGAMAFAMAKPVAAQGAGGVGAEMEFEPWGFHALNLLLHLCTALFLVFPLIERFGGKGLPALLGTLVFAIHPVQVEPVAWVSGLKDTLSGFFIFGPTKCKCLDRSILLFFIVLFRSGASIETFHGRLSHSARSRWLLFLG